MHIESSNPVGSPVQGVETTPTAGAVNREKENAAETEATPDYKLSLSEQSKNAMTELNAPQAADDPSPTTALKEEEAAQLASQVSAQLTRQPNTSLSNQAIQKAVDLFT